MSSARFLSIVLLLSISLGCDREADAPPAAISSTSSSTTAAEADLSLVKTVLAEQLGKKPAAIRADQTLAQLGADALDVVETVMELEDRLKISISDESLSQAAGGSSIDDVEQRLTVAQLAQIVTAARNEKK